MWEYMSSFLIGCASCMSKGREAGRREREAGRGGRGGAGKFEKA